jgi:hypothetical protein
VIKFTDRDDDMTQGRRDTADRPCGGSKAGDRFIAEGAGFTGAWQGVISAFGIGAAREFGLRRLCRSCLGTGGSMDIKVDRRAIEEASETLSADGARMTRSARSIM